MMLILVKTNKKNTQYSKSYCTADTDISDSGEGLKHEQTLERT